MSCRTQRQVFCFQEYKAEYYACDKPLCKQSNRFDGDTEKTTTPEATV